MVDALGGSSSVSSRAWWEDNKELWAEVHTEHDLDAELKGNGKDLVVIGIPLQVEHNLFFVECAPHVIEVLQTSMVPGVWDVPRCTQRFAE